MQVPGFDVLFLRKVDATSAHGCLFLGWSVGWLVGLLVWTPLRTPDPDCKHHCWLKATEKIS